MRLVKSKKALWLVAVVFVMVVGFGAMQWRDSKAASKTSKISVCINGVYTPWTESFTSSLEYGTYSDGNGYKGFMSTQLSSLTGLSGSWVVSTTYNHVAESSNAGASNWFTLDGLVKSHSTLDLSIPVVPGSGAWSGGIQDYELKLVDDRAFIAYMKDENTKITCKWPKLEDGVWNWEEPSAPTAPTGKKFRGWSTSTDHFEAAPAPGSTKKFDGIIYAYFVDKDATFTWDLNGADEGS